MKLATDDNKMTVLTNEDTPPSRPGPKFFAVFFVVVAGIAYLVFGQAIRASLGF
jgi:hypothetical protein